MTEALGLFHALQSTIILTHNGTLSALAAHCKSPLREFLMENIREGFLKCEILPYFLYNWHARCSCLVRLHMLRI